MRTELAQAVKAVLDGADHAPAVLTDHQRERLLSAADLVTRARTAVMYDRGNVTDAHAPEMPTRFTKQLTQLVRGGLAVGMNSDEAISLAIRCARDSIPPLRLAILVDLVGNPRSLVADVRKRLQKPHNTVDRALQALHMLGLVTLDEEPHNAGTRWLYSISVGIDTAAVFPQIEVPPTPQQEGGSTSKRGNADRGSTSIPGNTPVSSFSRLAEGGPVPYIRIFGMDPTSRSMVRFLLQLQLLQTPEPHLHPNSNDRRTNIHKPPTKRPKIILRTILIPHEGQAQSRPPQNEGYKTAHEDFLFRVVP